jgi:hypothetical protein
MELVLCLVVIISIWGYRQFERWRRRRAMALMRAAGRKGEVRAERWLRANGFSIVSDQVQRTCTLHVDGIARTFEVRADFLVEDPRGRLAVVEVKTGASASPTSSTTRRQILEYASVYGVQDVYLFDGSQERLMHMEFANQPSGALVVSSEDWFRWFFLGLVAGGVAVALFL